MGKGVAAWEADYDLGISGLGNGELRGRRRREDKVKYISQIQFHKK